MISSSRRAFGPRLSESTAPALLPRVARGDELAQRACLKRYASLVRAVVRRFARDPDDVAAACHDAFVALWRSAPAFDADRSEEAIFVTMVARRAHVARALERGEATHAVAGLPVGVSQTSAERYVDVRVALGALAGCTVDQLNVMVMVICHGLSPIDVARELALPLDVVHAHRRHVLGCVEHAWARGSLHPDGDALAEAALLLAHLDLHPEADDPRTHAPAC